MSPEVIDSNDTGITTRLEFIHALFKAEFKETPREVQAIAYEEDFPFPYNSFVYIVGIDSHSPRQIQSHVRPGTQEIPAESKKFVLCLANPAAGFDGTIRVENEVASLWLARDALQGHISDIIPRVFGWGSANNGRQGWILEEFMPGRNLAADLPTMKAEDQGAILEQIAEVLHKLQQYQLPISIDAYGGLTFNDEGQIISAPMTILQHQGPFSTYEELVLGTIRSKLMEADNDANIDGWRNAGIRDRLEEFLVNGVPRIMKEVAKLDKVLVHADFSTDNLLYNPETMRLTGVIDFDWAHIGTVADEFFRSLGHGIGRFPNPRDGGEYRYLNKAMLEGFPDPLPDATGAIEWPAAKMWDEALRARNMARPGNIPGMEGLSELFWLSSQILPFKLANEVVVRNSSKEQLIKRKEDGEKLLHEFLESHGF